MSPVLGRQLALAAGLILARMATRVLPDLAPDDARWINGALEVLLLAAETWMRTRRLQLRRSAAREEECRAERAARGRRSSADAG